MKSNFQRDPEAPLAIGNETKILEKQMKSFPVQSMVSYWTGMDPERVIGPARVTCPPPWQRRKGRELWSHLNLMEWISLRE